MRQFFPPALLQQLLYSYNRRSSPQKAGLASYMLIEGPASGHEGSLMNALFHRGHALLIGVGGDLPCTIRDVEGLRDILVNPERCAYPPDQVRLLTEENASVESIRAELKRL